MQQDNMSVFTVGSLFAGIGGIDIAFMQAGFEIAFANEMDKAACITYRNNFPGCNLVEDDIRSLNAKTLPDVDVIAAGFPCQPFSICGKQQGFNDKRGNLFFEIMRIVDAKKPRIIFAIVQGVYVISSSEAVKYEREKEKARQKLREQESAVNTGRRTDRERKTTN